MKKLAFVNILEHKQCNTFENPFFIHHKYILQNVYTDKTISIPYTNEFFDRKGIDCVAVIPYKFENNSIYVGILSAFRPPVYFRKNYKLYIKEPKYTEIFECVAGSLEKEDMGFDGLLKRAKEELLEEAGFNVSKNQIKQLGGSFFPSHGQSTEKIHMFCVNITNLKRTTPQGDGSVNEQLNKLHFFEINTLARMCFNGEIEDPKVEIGVNRLLYELRQNQI
jgi:hypothetical protein